MENKAPVQAQQPLSTPFPPPGINSDYVDPNGKTVNDAVIPVNYKPNKKLSIVLLALFLITAVAGITLTVNNNKKAREFSKPIPLVNPTSASKPNSIPDVTPTKAPQI